MIGFLRFILGIMENGNVDNHVAKILASAADRHCQHLIITDKNWETFLPSSAVVKPASSPAKCVSVASAAARP